MKRLIGLGILLGMLVGCSVTKVQYKDVNIEAKDYLFKRQSKISGTINNVPFTVEINRADSENISKLIDFGDKLATLAGGAAK